MPDLAQGYSADIVLNAGDSVRVSTTGQATVTSAYGAPAGTTTLNANTQLFGPYGVPAKLRVTAVSGAANYASPTLVPATVDPSTGQFSPPVSGAEITTWANRAALVAASKFNAFFTDVGVGGSYWFYSGGRWRPLGGRVTLTNLVAPVSNTTTAKTVLGLVTMMAGLLQDGDELQVRFLKEKTGGTADTDATDLGIGTVAATFGTSTGLSSSGLATTNLTLSSTWGIRRESATSVRRTTVIAASGSGAATSNNNAVTVPDMDAQTTYLQMSSQLTSGAGETAWLRTFQVTLMAGA